VLAHGIGSREDLPLPLEWAIAGAATAVVLSFVLLGFLWREPRLDVADAGRALPEGLARVIDGPLTRRLLAALGLLAAAWTTLALVFGTADARNPVPWVVYVLIWVGLVPVSVVLGPVWRRLNPVRTVHALVNRGLGLDPTEGIRVLPQRWGWWPAALGLLGFAWLELVSPDPASLTTLRLAIALYVTVHLFAGLTFGSTWYDRGDAFEAWSGLYGRMSPLQRRADGRLVLRAPVAGLALVPAAPGLAATVVVMLSSTAFDGLAGSTPWVTFVQQQSVSRQVTGTLGLLGVVLIIGALYAGCTVFAGRLAGLRGEQLRQMPAQFAPSLVPVACGYVVAHYYSLLVLEGQRAVVRLSDPLGIGADWLGTGSLTPSGALVRPTLVANIMVAAIVLGHVLGTLVAHDRAVRLFPRAAAVVGQLPLLALMVGLTCLGLFLLFWS
jgi:hypothetical protein